MNRRTYAARWLAPALLLATLAAPAAAVERRDEVSTPFEAIRAQAARERAPLWRMPLAGALIEDMELLTPDRLLLALRADATGTANLPLVLVDTRHGLELWRHERTPKDARWERVLADSVSLVYRVDDGRRARLVGLDGRTGAEAWSAPLAPNALPFADRAHGMLLVVEAARARVTLRALALATGAERWRREVKTANGDAAAPHPLFVADDVIHFHGGVERLAGADGRPRWSRADVVMPEGAPDARLDGDALFVVERGGALVELDAASGSTRHAVALPAAVDWDAIEAFPDRVYARGSRSDGTAVLVAVDRAATRVLWSHDCPSAPMSNVVSQGDRVFYATSGAVVALEAASGRSLGVWEATNASRPYPVHLRRAGGKVVYVGELMVAAFDPLTGRRAWDRGWTPIANNASLLALDASLPRLREELAGLAGRKARGAKTGSEPSFARLESARFQNMAADYSRRADDLSAAVDRSPGTSQNARSLARMGVNLERSSAVGALSGDIAITRMNATLDRATSMMNFQFAMMDLAMAIQRAKAVAATQTELARQTLFRRAVVGGYSRMEDADHAYRPGLEFAGGGAFVGVTVVQLTTGRTATALLSPSYRGYGLWNLVDFERGVVYHHGLGLDPSLYDFMPPRDVGGTATRIIGNFLIATPIAIPD